MRIPNIKVGMKNISAFSTSAVALLLSVVLSVSFFCASLHADGQSSDGTAALKHVKIADFLDRMLTPKELATPQCNTCTPASDSVLTFSTDPLSLDSHGLCVKADGTCKTLTPQSICADVEKKITRYDPTLNFPIELNEVNLKKRVESKELRKRVFSYTKTTFERIKGNQDFQSRCCKNDETCIASFSKTELYLLVGVQGEIAYYNLKKEDPAVEVSESQLLQCKTDSCIKQFLLHELGHACQYSRNHFRPELSDCQGLANFTVKDYEQDFGKASAQCILNKITAASKNLPINTFCTGSWYQEAYADAIFLDHWLKPSAFNYMCWLNLNKTNDLIHPPTSVSECVMSQPLFRKSICGQNEGCKK